MKKKLKKGKSNKKSNWIRTSAILVLLVVLAYTAFYYDQKDDTIMRKHTLFELIPEGFPSFGIDVSHHQGKIDWEELFQDQGLDSIINFVYCKSTEGDNHLDQQWEYNRKELIRLNKAHGTYHFLSLRSDPLIQATHFLKYWRKRDTDLPPVLDVETEGIPDSELISKMKIWLEEVEKRSGMRPIIYTSLHFYRTKFSEEFMNYKFWIAAYSQRPDCLEESRILHWQFSESGKLPGIKEDIDLNVSKTAF